jgi:hypothetical protein
MSATCLREPTPNYPDDVDMMSFWGRLEQACIARGLDVPIDMVDMQQDPSKQEITLSTDEQQERQRLPDRPNPEKEE